MVKARDSNWVSSPKGGDRSKKFGYLLGSARAGSNPAGVELVFSCFLFLLGGYCPTAIPEKQKAYKDEREGKKEREKGTEAAATERRRRREERVCVTLRHSA